MEFLKRKHFSLWITFLIILFVDMGYGLQGVPTWMCLGIKSPFIEFKNEIEILANTSISLNITKDEQVLMHEESLKKLGTFIKPVDLRNSSTGFVKTDLTKKLPPTPAVSGRRRKENPIAEEMDRKDIELLEEETDPNAGFPGLTEDDRKFIVPMALKNPTIEPKKIHVPLTLLQPQLPPPLPPQPQRPAAAAEAAASGVPAAPPISDFSTNIDDLKNHILMLQNMTKNDNTFQSKFVVFPSLQNNSAAEQTKSSSIMSTVSTIPLTAKKSRYGHPFAQTTIKPTTTTTTTTSSSSSSTTTTTTTPKNLESVRSKMLDYDEHHEDRSNDDDHGDYHKEISIIPQVLLLNDQTPPDDEDQNDEERHRMGFSSGSSSSGNFKENRMTYSRRRNFRKTTSTSAMIAATSLVSTTASTTTTTTTTTTTERPRRNLKRQRDRGHGGGGGSGSNGRKGEKRNKKRQQNCKNFDTPRCQRQRRRQLALSLNMNKTLLMTSGERPYLVELRNKTNSPSEADLFWLDGNGGSSSISSSSSTTNQNDKQKLSRSVRSHHIRRNTGGGSNLRSGLTSSYDGAHASRDFIIPVGNVINNNNNNNQSSSSLDYKENVDLNPDLCYKVDGMTYGQQKLCVLHTSIMPAISRGARSAIQECQHQFKNRRWNCSTTEDNTVFGPMTSLGSPEMAFIHALAAATVTSFIARSCRDGQLTYCGCSRSSRPNQLHDDWTWGGCGDDLEYAYKFAQDFIDIRERERKRGTRGLVSVPPKNKFEEKFQSESSSGADNGTKSEQPYSSKNSNLTSSYKDDNLSPFKPEDLLELQEKITKEILNSKLQEKEMLELQEKINREILNSKVFNLEHHAIIYGKKQHQRTTGSGQSSTLPRMKNGFSTKARSLMNLHNNEAGRRAVIKKTRITCKCHGVSGSCSLITCWQQLSSIRELGDYLREKYDAATQVKLNKRGRLQVRDARFKVPTAHDLVYLDESPDWCRNNRQLQWPGTHGRTCNKTSSGLDGCAILCCGRGYNTKRIVVRERCNCKFHWCCQVKCEICVKILEEHSCK